MSYEKRVPELSRIIIAIITGCFAGYGLANHYHFNLLATLISVVACATICWFMVDPISVLSTFGQEIKKQAQKLVGIHLKPLPKGWIQQNVEWWKLATRQAATSFVCMILTGFGVIAAFFQIICAIGIAIHDFKSAITILQISSLIVLPACVLVTVFEFIQSSTTSIQKLQVKLEGREGSIVFFWRVFWRVCLPLPLWLVLFALKTIALAIIYTIGICHSTARLTAMVHGVAGLLLMISTGQPLLGLTIGIVTGALSYQLLMKDQHVGFRRFATERFRSEPFRLSAELD